VGSLYAGKFAQAGASVSAACRSDYDVVKIWRRYSVP